MLFTRILCFEIPNISVLFVADLGGLGWKLQRLDLAEQYVHSCTLLKSLHAVKANGCLKSFQQFCRLESLMSEKFRIWLHFPPFSLEPVCKDLNGTLFKE